MLRLRTLGGLFVVDSSGTTLTKARPRALAMLAVLAAARSRSVSRERLLGILWADSSPDKARHALSQTLYSLRRDVGADVVAPGNDLRLDPQAIASDVTELRAAVEAADWEKAAELYAGPFLDGFYLADAPDFERWADAERSDIQRIGLEAVERVATAREAAGNHRGAADSWRQLTRLDPLSDAYATGLMKSLAATGDRAGAIAHGRRHQSLVRRELESDPGSEFVELMQRLRTVPPPARPLRRRTGGASTAESYDLRDSLDETGEQAANIGVDDPRQDIVRKRRMSLPLLAAGVVLAGAVATFAAVKGRGNESNDGPVIAVGRIRDLVTPDSVRVGSVLGEMLTTSLGRLYPLQVVANSRMLELTPRDADTARSALADAARRAGATEVIEGELVPLSDGKLRLDVRRVDLARGRIRAGYGVVGDDRIGLLDSITALIAADLRIRPPSASLAEVSTRSPLAHRYYEDGLRAFYQFDAYAANRLFRAALREDSMFAMAAYYAWRSAVETADSAQFRFGTRATMLASRASERDRLMILTHIGGAHLDARSIQAAESLGTRYPSDPEALVRAAGVLRGLNRRTALLNRAIALDSAAGTSLSSICRMCDAFEDLAQGYAWADSSAMVERTLKRWIAARPDDATPWRLLADHYVSVNRPGDAQAAQSRGEALGGRQPQDPERRLTWALRLDDVDGAISQCTSLLTVDRDTFENHAWWCLIGLRMAGRLRDAESLLKSGKVPGAQFSWRKPTPDPVHAAILQFESGNSLEAAKGFASLGFYFGDSTRASAGWKARTTTWHMTLAATAAIAGGDTARARSLLDSIQVVGRRSLYDRDQLLHHFVRGSLLAKGGRHADAVREFRAAISSPTNGYTRINYELAKSLIALGRPAEAIPVLSAVLRGGLEGSGLYLTRTEAHDLLARAYESAGQRDSAKAHFAVVERSWRRADPAFRARYEYARQRARG